MTSLIPLIIKYWPVIKFLLDLLRSNSGLLKELVDRPDTCAGQDCRDFFREIEKRDEWNPFKDIWSD